MIKILLYGKKIILQFAPPALYKKIVFRGLNKMNFRTPPAEEIELLLIPFLLKKDSIFFDVGANIGTYTYKASNCIPEKNIYAFEPIPSSFIKLQRAFSKVNLYNLAFTANTTNTTTQFKIPSINGNAMQTRGSLNINYTEPDETSAEIIEVNIDTIDNFTNKNKLNKVDFIKIDVEGHEEEVIKGALQTLQSFKPILQVEIEQRHNTFHITKIFERLEAIGYLSYYFTPHLLEFIPLHVDPASLQNLENFKNADYINNFYFFHNNNFDFNLLEIIHQKINN